MKKYLNSGLFFVLFLVCYWIHKYEFLTLPYFLDELGVYIQWVYGLCVNGISLSPDTVSPEFTRGHPPLFAFIYALVFKWSGFSNIIIHGFSLLISTILGIVTFIFIKKYTTSLVALFSSILLLVQPIVLAQSTLVLPEIMLTLFILLTAFSIYENRYLSYFFFASCALLTKESGLVCISSSVVFFILTYHGTFKEKLVKVFFLLSPLIFFISFFIIQKIKLGWFFFPYHLSLMSFDFSNFTSQFSHAFRFLFEYQGRIVFTILIFTSLFGFIFSNVKTAHKNLVILCFVFIFFGILFSSFNFYMHRYMLMLLPFWVILIAMSVFRLNLNKYLVSVLIVLCFIKSNDCIRYRYFNYDNDYTFYDNLMAQLDAYNYIKNNMEDGEVVYSVFPLWAAFTYEINGFNNFKKINSTSNPNEKYQWVAYVTIDTKDVIKDFSNLVLVHHQKFGIMESKIYKVR